MTNRERASAFADPLDLSGFEPKAGKPPVDKNAVREAANRAGFITKHAPAKAAPISGRNLRRSNKTAQLNIAVSENTRERFWTLAQDYDCGTGEELITMLLDKFEGKDQRD